VNFLFFLRKTKPATAAVATPPAAKRTTVPTPLPPSSLLLPISLTCLELPFWASSAVCLVEAAAPAAPAAPAAAPGAVAAPGVAPTAPAAPAALAAPAAPAAAPGAEVLAAAAAFEAAFEAAFWDFGSTVCLEASVVVNLTVVVVVLTTVVVVVVVFFGWLPTSVLIRYHIYIFWINIII